MLKYINGVYIVNYFIDLIIFLNNVERFIFFSLFFIFFFFSQIQFYVPFKIILAHMRRANQ